MADFLKRLSSSLLGSARAVPAEVVPIGPFTFPSRMVHLDGLPSIAAIDTEASGFGPANLAPVVIDMRGEHGEGCIVQKIGALLDRGEVVALWDPQEDLQSFIIGKLPSHYVVGAPGGQIRGAFATIEAALKFGLTTKQEADLGRP